MMTVERAILRIYVWVCGTCGRMNTSDGSSCSFPDCGAAR
jgi:hypothetical protein